MVEKDNRSTSEVIMDEFGIPIGQHEATCGCKFKGRALVEPCNKHEWLSKGMQCGPSVNASCED